MASITAARVLATQHRLGAVEQALVDAGEVDVLRTEDGESIYRLCAGEAHHHHLVCRECGLSIEITGGEVETWAARTARRHGFTSVTHTAELYGLCTGCSSG